MKSERGENQIFLRGYLAEAPRFSHESHGAVYHTFPLTIPRLSGVDDRLNILVPCTLLELVSPEIGEMLEISGEVRSFNNRSGVGSKLVISVLARTVCRSDGPPANDLLLSGALCRPPNLRHTPLGRDICDLLLAVNRRYGRSDYLPCIAWGSLAGCVVGAAMFIAPGKKLYNYSIFAQFVDILPHILLSAFMGLCVWGVSLIPMHNLLSLVAQVGTGVVVYVALSIVFKMECFHYVKDQLFALLNR